MSNQFLFARMASPRDLRPAHRRWNGNDRSQRNHNGAVPLAEDPFDVVLNWKASPTAPVCPVGCFRLDLAQLLSAGYVRLDKRRGHIRLRFFHDDDGCVYIETAQGRPRLLIGRAD